MTSSTRSSTRAPDDLVMLWVITPHGLEHFFEAIGRPRPAGRAGAARPSRARPTWSPSSAPRHERHKSLILMPPFPSATPTSTTRNKAGPCLMLVPGLCGLGAFWGDQVRDFARDFRVIVHDHRGAGRSTHSRIQYSVDQMANDTSASWTAQHRSAHFVGHSTGGAMASDRLEHPGASSLVLSATWAGPDPYFRALLRDPQGALLHSGFESTCAAPPVFAVSAAWISEQRRAAREEMKRLIRGAAPDRGLASRIDAIVRHDRRARLGEIRVPTLVMVAARRRAHSAPLLRRDRLADPRRQARGGGHRRAFRARHRRARLQRSRGRLSPRVQVGITWRPLPLRAPRAPPEAEALREEVREFLRETVGEAAPRRARAHVGRLRPRVLEEGGRARLDRHDVAQEVRRPRAHRARALRRARGDAGGGRAGERALGGRPPERPAAPPLRHRGAAPALPAAASRAASSPSPSA